MTGRSPRRWAVVVILALTASLAVAALTAGPGAAWGGHKQGCTLGYWKTHVDEWSNTGYSPDQLVSSVFGNAPADLGSATLLDALSFGGGPDVEGAAQLLLQQAVAALLNAADPGVNYPLTPSKVIQLTNKALASGDRDTMLQLKTRFDTANNFGCPLS
jgi:hypothetical protein